MKSAILLGIGSILALTSPAIANDHNNLDSDRPLSFEDAESIGFGEQSLEFGSSVVFPENRSVGGEFSFEYLNGVILNGHMIIGIEPSVGGRVDSEDTDFDIGNLSVGFFYNFNREYDSVPAFAVRADAALPTGNDASGVDFRLRGIASKSVGQYDRLHLNLDLEVKTDPDSEDRSVIPGLILGYSTPLGYPRSFDRTFLAELGVLAGENVNGGVVIRTGVGLRQQIGLQNILDIGIEGDIATGSEGNSQLKLTIGYSFGF
jgi:hypothetical protein